MRQVPGEYHTPVQGRNSKTDPVPETNPLPEAAHVPKADPLPKANPLLEVNPVPKASHVPKEWEFDDVFDAVDLGCGEFLIDFNMHIRPLPAGSVIMLATRDIASPMEVPAWCRLTGNRLLEHSHPFYLIRKKQG